MRRDTIAILTISTTAVFIVLILLAFSGIKNPPADVAFIENNFIMPVGDFIPEPRERMQFIASVILFPIICALFFVGFKNQFDKLRGNYFNNYFLLSIIVVVFLFLLVFIEERNTNNNYLGNSSLKKAPLIAVAFSVVLLLENFILQLKSTRKVQAPGSLWTFLYFFAGIFIIMLLVLETVFSETDIYVPQFHFIAYFDAIVQTYLGKTLLVDNNAQYGLYPLILKPIFNIIGLSVFKFSLIMSLIKGLIFISLLALLWHISENKLIAFLGFTTLAFFSRIRIPVDLNADPYFQYWPHRLIFPAFFICLLWLYSGENNTARKKILYYFISIFCALAVLWNLDTGLVVFISWLAALFYMEFLSIKFLKVSKIAINCVVHAGIAGGVLIISLFGLYIYSYWAGGKPPQLSDLLIYPRLFYNHGFYLLPITNAIHPWNLVVLVYITGFFVPMRYLLELKGEDRQIHLFDKRTRLIILTFALTIMGIGLFNYYISRSHDYNLIGPSWPLIPLLVIFSDQVFNELYKIVRRKALSPISKTHLFARRIHKVVLFFAIFTLFSSSILSLSYYLAPYTRMIGFRMTNVQAGMPEFLAGEVELIKANTNKNDQVLILSDYAPELYLYTNTPRALPVPGFGNDLVLKSDMDKIISFLEAPPPNAKIFWDPQFTTVVPSQYKNLLITDIYGDDILILYENK